MAISKKKQEELLKFAGLVIGGIAAYKLLFTQKKATVIVAEVVETPIKIVKVAAKHTKEIIKDVAEAFMSKDDFKKAFKDVKFKVSKGELTRLFNLAKKKEEAEKDVS